MKRKAQAKLASQLFKRLARASPSVEEAAEIVVSLAVAVIVAVPSERRVHAAAQFVGRIAMHSGLHVVIVSAGRPQELPRG